MNATCLLLLVLTSAEVEDRPARAKAMLTALLKADFAEASKGFTPLLKEKLPQDKLKEVWIGIGKQLGPFKKVTATNESKVKDSNLVDLTCQFDKALIKLRISFDKDDRIQGFFLLPATAPKFDPPPYAVPTSYVEEKVTVGEQGDWPLPGTLTLPKAKGPFPAVVLLHGSGPHDRDETIGPNKPFRDLAWGLASKGVAVLRFEKRTYVHGAKMLDAGLITPQEEVIADALAAVKLLRAHKQIDPKKVFLLGHSLGAMLAPRIGQLDDQLAGLILLAGNSRPLEDLVMDQFTYLYTLEGMTEEHKKKLEVLDKKVQTIRSGKFTAETPSKELPLGMPAPYWKALKAYDQVGVARTLTMPLLILQGERDYQVTMDDFAGWKKALQGKKSVTLKSYPTLNHLFHPGKGKSTPNEYQQAGHVAQEVLDDIASWVKGH